MKKILVGIVLCFISLGARAADHKNIEVCSVQSHSNGAYAFIEVCGGWVSKSGCPGANYIAFNMSTHQGKSMLSTATAALLSDKFISVRLTNGSCHSYDLTTMIRLQKSEVSN